MMSRELILIKKCDLCQREDDNVDVPATVTYTVGIVQGESRLVPKVLDVCDDHAGPLEDLLTVMADIHQLPGDSPQVAKKAARASVKAAAREAPPRGGWQCPVCHQWLVGNPVTHVWAKHRPDGKPPMPTTCPECGEQYSGPGMASHRRLAHGFDAVANALSGVPGYQPPKPTKGRKESPPPGRKLPPEQMELTGT